MSLQVSNTNRLDAMNAAWSRTTGSSGVNASQWERFFGPLHGVQQPDPFAKARYTNYQLPEAYIGRNVFLEQRVKGFLQESELIETTVLLPWMQTEEHHFIWNEWTFNRTLAGRVPHEGISRMVTTSKQQFRTHTVRRGLAFMMEGDFLRHADGQRQYENNLEGITQSIMETQSYDTVHEILVANDRRRELERKVGTTKVSIADQIREEKKNFAALNRHPQTFVVTVDRFKRLLMKKGIRPPYTLLIPPESTIFMSQINPYPESTIVPYYIFGPEGQLLRRDNMRSNSTLPDGTAVFEIRDYIVDEDGIPIQLLTRKILVSEYYTMAWGDHRSTRLWHGCRPEAQPKYGPYQTQWRAIQLFDMEKDTQRTVTLRNAFLHARGFDEKKMATLLRRAWSPQDFDPSLDKHGNHDRNLANDPSVRRRAYWRLFWDSDEAHEVRYYGQMDAYVAEPGDHLQVGQTMLAGITGLPDDCEIKFQAALTLMQELERAPYHHEFVKRMLEANASQNYDSDGRFVGESLAEGAPDLIQARGYLDLTEWKGLEHGGMALPPSRGRGMENLIAPPGFASLAGLTELARHAGKDDGWGMLGSRADEALEVLRMLHDRIKESKRGCPGVDANNRLPWHHPHSSFAAFFSTLFYVPRDAIFAPALPLETDAEGRVVGQTTGVSVTEGAGTLEWRPVPLLEIGAGAIGTDTAGNFAAISAAIDNVVSGNVVAPEAGAAPGRYYIVQGKEGYTIANRLLLYGMTLSPEFLAFKRMGSTSGNALLRVRNRLVNLTATHEGRSGEQMWDSLVNIMNASPKSARSIALGLDAKINGRPGRGRSKKVVPAMEDEAAIARLAYVLTTVDADLISEDRTAKKALLKEIKALGQSAGPDADVAVLRSESGDPFQMVGDDRGFNAERAQIEQLNRVSRDRIAPLVQRIRDLVGALQEQRATAGADVSGDIYVMPGSFGPEAGTLGDIAWVPEDFTQVTSATFPDSALRDQLVGAEENLRAVLREFYQAGRAGGAGGMAGIVDEIGGNPMDDQTVQGRRGGGILESQARSGAPRMLFDQVRGLPGSRWHRLAGLAWTPGLAESIAKVRFPLLRPSDPATGHTQPVASGGAAEGFTLPERLWKRPEYARVQEIIRTRGPRHTPWMGHHAEYAAWLDSGASSGSTAASNRYRGDMFPARDDDDSMEDIDGSSDASYGERALLRELVAPRPSRSSRQRGSSQQPANKRMRRVVTDVEPAGAHYWDATYKDPTGGWDRGTVFKGKGGGDRRRPFQASIYADSLSEGVRELVEGLSVGNFVYNFQMTAKIPNAMVRLMTRAHLMSPCWSADHWIASMDADVHVPINIILWRLMIELAMDSMVLMKSGLETGANLFGHSNFILGTDVQTKVIYGNFTFKSKANVWRPENIIVLENIKARAYLGGMDMSWVTHKADFKMAPNVRPSMVAMLVPITENVFPEDLSIAGTLEFADENAALDPRAKWPQFSSAEYYNLLYGFEDQLHHQQIKRSKYFGVQNVVPPVSSQGQQIPFNPVIGGFDYEHFTECRSSLGADGCYSGAGQVWKGNKPYFQRQITSQRV